MTSNIGIKVATIVLGAIVVVATVLALLGGDPNTAVEILLPIFVIAVFVAVGIGLFNAARS